MEKSEAEKRKYIRLDTVFPVEFQLVNDKKEPLSEMYQAFTKNISEGGLCIEIRSEKDKEPFKLISNETKIKLIVNIPTGVIPTQSYAVVKWQQRISEPILDINMFGVEYTEIEDLNKKMIVHHAKWIQKKPRVLAAYFLLLAILIISLMYIAIRS